MIRALYKSARLAATGRERGQFRTRTTKDERHRAARYIVYMYKFVPVMMIAISLAVLTGASYKTLIEKNTKLSGRSRRLLRSTWWGLAILLVLSILAAVSKPGYVYRSGGFLAGLKGGEIFIAWMTPQKITDPWNPPPEGFSAIGNDSDDAFKLRWWPRLPPSVLPPLKGFHLPLLLPILMVSLFMCWAIWRNWPFPNTSCQACGYNMTGNISGICPECGEKI